VVYKAEPGKAPRAASAHSLARKEALLAQSTDQLLSEEERRRFLELIAADTAGRGENQRLSITGACKRLRIHKYLVTALIAREPAFAEQYREARGYSQDQIRNVWIERAIDGYEEVTVRERDGVVETTTTTKFDNRLLALGMKAYLPEFADHATVEVRGQGGGAIQQDDRSATLADLARVLQEAGVLDKLGFGAPRRELPDVEGVLAITEVSERAASGVPDP
jgi:hypothetical protein